MSEPNENINYEKAYNAGFIIIPFILLIIFLGFIIWVSVDRSKNENPILNNVRMMVEKTTEGSFTITANWDSASNDNDRVTLYASNDGPIQLNEFGEPINEFQDPTLPIDTIITSSSSTLAKEGNVSVIVFENVTYNVSLVVKSGNKNYTSYNDNFFVTENVPETMVLSELNQNGSILISNDGTELEYIIGVNNTTDTVWSYDSTTQLITSEAFPEKALFNNNGVLSVKDTSEMNDSNSLNFKWKYTTENNFWCLSESKGCIELEIINQNSSPQIIRSLKVNGGSKWINREVLNTNI